MGKVNIEQKIESSIIEVFRDAENKSGGKKPSFFEINFIIFKLMEKGYFFDCATFHYPVSKEIKEYLIKRVKKGLINEFCFTSIPLSEYLEKNVERGILKKEVDYDHYPNYKYFFYKLLK